MKFKLYHSSAARRAEASERRRIDPRFTSGALSGNPQSLSRSTPRPAIRSRSERAIALVITLLMLSVITFLAISFLVLSRREKNSASTTVDQTQARLAADSAFDRAKGQILAQVLVFTNDQNFDLMVSTNFVNGAGFDPNLPSTADWRTNVNYDFTITGVAMSNSLPNYRLAVLTNLLYDPRPPVFVPTNITPTNVMTDFRFYRDENRNGRFDPTGMLPVTGPWPNATNITYYDTNGTPIGGLATNLPDVLSNYFVGDPQWIGVLEFPNRPHSSTNRFVSRYCYMVVPADKTLDVNYIHNEAVTESVLPNTSGFLRNQGVGTWEINLASFLTDLNTNVWWGPQTINYNPVNPYHYLQPLNSPFGLNNGIGFQDAQTIIAYRYANNYNNLATALNAPVNAFGFFNDAVDEYCDQTNLLMFGTTNIPEVPPFRNTPTLPWAGSDNPNHYFTVQDIFNQTAGTPFYTNLINSGTSNDTYDSYTYYRMLSQLGTDSDPDRRLNVNYINVDTSGNVVPGMETNLISWGNPYIAAGIPGVIPAYGASGATVFFTNAAARMFAQLNLRDGRGNPITITNIPVYPTNYYTPAVHRILQLVANIYDSTTNRSFGAAITNAFYPSVFRPLFRRDNSTNIYIAGFREAQDAELADVPAGSAPTNVDLNIPASRAFIKSAGTPFGLTELSEPVVAGIPLVIGAKKGWPNFNRYALVQNLKLTRKLQLSRNQASGPVAIQEVFMLGITNEMVTEAWNSYSNDWPVTSRPLEMIVANDLAVLVSGQTNPANKLYMQDNPMAAIINFPSTISTWRGFYTRDPITRQTVSVTNSMIFPLQANYTTLDGNTFSFQLNPPAFVYGTNYNPTTLLTPQWYVITTNHFRYALVDPNIATPGAQYPGRIVDFVNLDDSGKIFDLTAAITNGACTIGLPATNAMWCPEAVHGTPNVPNIAPGTLWSIGLDNQIQASLNEVTVTGFNPNDATNSPGVSLLKYELLNSSAPFTNQTTYNPYYETNLVTFWEANDPLVHYIIPDLLDQQPSANWVFLPNTVNHHYRPWPQNPDSGDPAPVVSYLLSVKDPQVIQLNQPQGTAGSDNWDFPTNILPNVGWLGRVHRGTPWQTVDLKSSAAFIGNTNPLSTWIQWSGDTNYWGTNNWITNLDANYSMPTNDWMLFDLFTATPNDNAGYGRLNVNQTNLAAWSAVLGGVVVLTNRPLTSFIGWTNISPAGVYDPTNTAIWPPMAQIWRSINAARANTNPLAGPIFQNWAFQHAGDVLSAPQLADRSPYLTNATAYVTNRLNGINDEVMERIPQQIMGLLSVSHSPRFVVYSFGQTLHPAENSVVAGGPFNGVCTNYQITAESATRAVVRVDGSLNPQYTQAKNNPDPKLIGKTSWPYYPPHIVVEQFNVLPSD